MRGTAASVLSKQEGKGKPFVWAVSDYKMTSQTWWMCWSTWNKGGTYCVGCLKICWRHLLCWVPQNKQEGEENLSSERSQITKYHKRDECVEVDEIPEAATVLSASKHARGTYCVGCLKKSQPMEKDSVSGTLCFLLIYNPGWWTKYRKAVILIIIKSCLHLIFFVRWASP
jgi:hypothetical protein